MLALALVVSPPAGATFKKGARISGVVYALAHSNYRPVPVGATVRVHFNPQDQFAEVVEHCIDCGAVDNGECSHEPASYLVDGLNDGAPETLSQTEIDEMILQNTQDDIDPMDPADVDALIRLKVGAHVSFGGGAAPLVVITRKS
jgi:hypothetical protein